MKLTSLASIAVVGLVTGCSGSEDIAGAQSSVSTPCSGPACGETPPTPSTDAGTGEAATTPSAGVDANLQALRDLNIFEVKGLLVTYSENANCYNLPCPGHEAEFVSYEDADKRAAAALDAFTHAAIEAASKSALDLENSSSGHCYDTDAENLKVLQDLQIVKLGDLVLEAPGQNPNCYTAPRGQKLARIAAALRKP